MIEVTDLHKSFHSKVVHNGVTFQVGTGEVFTLIGGSGSGKSVLLKQIAGLIKPDSGSIKIHGVDTTAIDEDRLHDVQKMIGYVFQEAALFDSLTVGENVAFGLCNLMGYKVEDTAQIVKEKLALVGLSGAESYKPAQLSGGMKKRVGIARAIAFEPKILLYDEPTTGLDPVMSDVISDLILKLKREHGVTSIAVTHDMKSAFKISDRMAMIYDGRILEAGAPRQFQDSANPVVRQFIAGSSHGPIPVPDMDLA